LSNKHKNSKVKIPANIFIQHHQPRIRNATKDVSRPIGCAESACGLRLSIAPLVVALQPKRSKLGSENLHSEEQIFTQQQ
jgi:hypothetical protein